MDDKLILILLIVVSAVAAVATMLGVYSLGKISAMEVKQVQKAVEVEKLFVSAYDKAETPGEKTSISLLQVEVINKLMGDK